MPGVAQVYSGRPGHRHIRELLGAESSDQVIGTTIQGCSGGRFPEKLEGFGPVPGPGITGGSTIEHLRAPRSALVLTAQSSGELVPLFCGPKAVSRRPWTWSTYRKGAGSVRAGGIIIIPAEFEDACHSVLVPPRPGGSGGGSGLPLSQGNP